MITKMTLHPGRGHDIEIWRKVEEHEYDPIRAAVLFGNWEAAERLMQAGAKTERFVVTGPWEVTIDGRPGTLEEARALMTGAEAAP